MQLDVLMANCFNIIFTSSLGPVQLFEVSNENKVSSERGGEKKTKKQTHKDLAAVASAASFFSQNTFWEVKDCTELLILNSSQDL